jgi:ubiquinone/menaquinone biosynthesis C-methylase UbiE
MMLMFAYDTAAPRFDRHRVLPDGVAPAVRTAVLSSISEIRQPLLLDLGAGTGRIGWPFVATGDDYIGVDLSLGMLREFMGRAEWNAPARLVQADGERLPFPDARFDAVLLMQVLNAVRDGRKLIAEAGRVLQPAGCLIFGRTVAPDNGIDARMKTRLAEILAGMDIHPYRGKPRDDAMAWLASGLPAPIVLTAAAWLAERTPRGFLERHGGGARFSILPEPVKQEALRRLAAWAIEQWGHLESICAENYRFELTIHRLQPGTTH